jgi:hypothetical protein
MGNGTNYQSKKSAEDAGGVEDQTVFQVNHKDSA